MSDDASHLDQTFATVDLAFLVIGATRDIRKNKGIPTSFQTDSTAQRIIADSVKDSDEFTLTCALATIGMLINSLIEEVPGGRDKFNVMAEMHAQLKATMGGNR